MSDYRPATALKAPPRRLPSDQDASGRSLGAEEIEAVTAALRSGVLTSTKGTFVKRLETDFAELLGVAHAFACSSGTSAIHTAVAAIDPAPGDEIVVSPITDMGALAPILYQGAIPVFADVDRTTLNVTAETIAARLGPRTRAIVVTPLFGNPCAMAPIMELAHHHQLRVIEDCAQAFLAADGGRPAGTIGTIGCFSLQQGKHITTGEGGLVVTDDAALARRMFLFINKAWGYGDPEPDHTFLALNSRLSELAGAVAVAQLAKLPALVARRIASAERFAAALAGVPGITPPRPRPGSVHSYWRFALDVDPAVIPKGPGGLAARLREDEIPTAPRYIQKPAVRCAVFRDQTTFGGSRFPFTLARPEAVDYREELFPGTFAGLRRVLVVPWNEGLSDAHVDYLAERLITAAEELRLLS